MADWPTVADLELVLNVEGPAQDAWNDILTAVLASAIRKVKADVGGWDDLVDEPDDTLSQAALRMASLLAEHQGFPVTILANDPAYRTFRGGKRRTFAVS